MGTLRNKLLDREFFGGMPNYVPVVVTLALVLLWCHELTDSPFAVVLVATLVAWVGFAVYALTKKAAFKKFLVPFGVGVVVLAAVGVTGLEVSGLGEPWSDANLVLAVLGACGAASFTRLVTRR